MKAFHEHWPLEQVVILRDSYEADVMITLLQRLLTHDTEQGNQPLRSFVSLENIVGDVETRKHCN